MDEAPGHVSLCPSWATGVGYMGVAAAVVLSNWGSAVSSPRSFRGRKARRAFRLLDVTLGNS
jgi:hypothetical protein